MEGFIVVISFLRCVASLCLTEANFFNPLFFFICNCASSAVLNCTQPYNNKNLIKVKENFIFPNIFEGYKSFFQKFFQVFQIFFQVFESTSFINNF